MARNLGVQVGLLAFGVAIVAGLYAGNSATSVLARGLMAMVFGVIVGQIAGWAAKLVLRDHLQKIKLRIDREHLAAIEALTGEPLLRPSEPSAEEDADAPVPAPQEPSA